jgi:hypothetical protein
MLVEIAILLNKKYNLKAEVIPAIKDSIPLIATATCWWWGHWSWVVWLIDKYIFDEKLLNCHSGIMPAKV